MRVSDVDGSPFGAVVAACLLAVTGLFTGFLVAIVGLVLVGEVVAIPQGSPERAAILLVGQGIGLVGVGVVYLSSRDLPPSYLRLEWPSGRDVAWALAATLGLLATLAVVLVVVELLGLSASEHSTVQSAQDNPQILLPLIPLSILVTGPAEELLFRGIIQTAFVERVGIQGGVVAASVIFALIHLPNYGGLDGLPMIGVLFLVSLAFGFVYERTDNLFVPAMVHAAFNAVQFGLLYVGLKYGSELSGIVLW